MRGRGDDGVLGRSLVASARAPHRVRSPLPAFGPSGPRQPDPVAVSRVYGEHQGGRPNLRQLDRSVTRCHLHPAVELRDESHCKKRFLVVVRHINGGRPEEGAQVVVHRRGERRQSESERRGSRDAAPGGSSHQAMPWAGLPMSMDRSRGTRWSSVPMRGSTRRPDSVRVTSTVTVSRRRENDDRRGLAPGLHQGKPQDAGPWPSRSQSLRLLIVSSRTTSSEELYRSGRFVQPAQGEQLLDQKEPLSGQSGPLVRNGSSRAWPTRPPSGPNSRSGRVPPAEPGSPAAPGSRRISSNCSPISGAPVSIGLPSF